VMTENNGDYSTAYRPRYSEEESSDAAFDCDERHRRCLSRKRRAASILIFFAFTFSVGVVTRVYLFFFGIKGSKLPSSYGQRQTSLWSSYWKSKAASSMNRNMAQIDSNGFFDIPDYQWHEIKQETKTIIDVQDRAGHRTAHLLSESGADVDSNLWWMDNWKINFRCRNKVNIGGKWICDLTRILAMANETAKPGRRHLMQHKNPPPKECIVYVSGGREMEFAHRFLDYSLSRMMELHFPNGTSGEGFVVGDLLPCEVHVFTPHGQEIPDARDGLFLHHWGFRPSVKESMGLATNHTTSIAFKTLDETITELKHSGRISIVAVDCEDCEWNLYRDILSLDEPIRQVLMQMHGTPFMANELFLHMQEAGYVIFQRQAEPSGSGEVYDYSWLNLAPSFFNWKV